MRQHRVLLQITAKHDLILDLWMVRPFVDVGWAGWRPLPEPPKAPEIDVWVLGMDLNSQESVRSV